MIKKLLTIIVTIAVVLSLALGMLFSYITREFKHNSASPDKGKLDFVEMFDSNKIYIIGGIYMNNREAPNICLVENWDSNRYFSMSFKGRARLLYL